MIKWKPHLQKLRPYIAISLACSYTQSWAHIWNSSKARPWKKKKTSAIESPNQINVGNIHIKKSSRISIMNIKCLYIYFYMIWVHNFKVCKTLLCILLSVFWNSSILLNLSVVCSFLLLSSIPLIDTPIYPFTSWWILGLFLDFGYYEQR